MKSLLAGRLLAFLLLSAFSVEALAWQSARRSQGRRQVDVRLIDQQISTANANSYSFTVDLPPPSADRVLLVVVYGLRNEANRNLNSLTVNGIGITESYGLGLPMYFRWLKNDSLVGPQTFTATYSGTLDRSGIAVFEVYGWNMQSVDGQYQNTQVASKSYSYSNIPKGSKILCLVYNANPNDVVWTNADEVYDVTLESSDRASVGMRDVVTSGNQSFTVASAGGAFSITILLRSK
ncbi:MAG: hypothetical protein KF789_00820 [Bdellovibrionaceae bacterium]|nr:hypothetical protein [Pseudobdellovibrionaceae bacterium]